MTVWSERRERREMMRKTGSVSSMAADLPAGQTWLRTVTGPALPAPTSCSPAEPGSQPRMRSRGRLSGKLSTENISTGGFGRGTHRKRKTMNCKHKVSFLFPFNQSPHWANNSRLSSSSKQMNLVPQWCSLVFNMHICSSCYCFFDHTDVSQFWE